MMFKVLFVFYCFLHVAIHPAFPVSNGQANREPTRQSQVGGGNGEVVVTCCDL